VTCSPGYFYDIQTHTCKVCPIGSYQMDYGQNYCLACPGDTITDHDATTNVSECKSMYIVYQNKKLSAAIIEIPCIFCSKRLR
jgi:hypothetical protein